MIFSDPSQAWPSEIRLTRDKNQLRIVFLDGFETTLTAEFLRVYSPSAEVRGHGSEDRKLESGKKQILISDIEPVGNYAVRLRFSDGHHTGLFSWAYFYEIGKNQDTLWQAYLKDLEKSGLSRE